MEAWKELPGEAAGHGLNLIESLDNYEELSDKAFWGFIEHRDAFESAYLFYCVNARYFSSINDSAACSVSASVTSITTGAVILNGFGKFFAVTVHAIAPLLNSSSRGRIIRRSNVLE